MKDESKHCKNWNADLSQQDQQDEFKEKHSGTPFKALKTLYSNIQIITFRMLTAYLRRSK